MQIVDPALIFVTLPYPQTMIAAEKAGLPVEPVSVCVHGDTPGATVIAQAQRDALLAENVDIVTLAKILASR